MPEQVLITGASSGIGEAFARAYARAGANVILIARRQHKLQMLSAELEEKHGIKATPLRIDLSAPDACREIINHITEHQIEVDVLINNAGYGVPGTFMQNEWQDHQASNQLMIASVMELSHGLLPGMIERRRGNIVNIASIAGMIPATAGHTLYGAVKAWMIRFSESLYDELKPYKIKVLAVCPGFTLSEFHDVTGTRNKVDKLPKIFWMTSEQVVTQSIKALGKNDAPIFVPGHFNRLLVLLVKLLPDFILRRIVKSNATFARNEV